MIIVTIPRNFAPQTINMKFPKALCILILLPLLDLLIACCDCPDETLQSSYSNCTLELKQLDNAGPSPLESSSPEIKKRAYGLRLTLARKEGMCFNKINTFFTTSVNAFSCECPPTIIYTPQDSIVSIQVFTQNAFDATHPAGSEISSYFHVLTFGAFYTLDEFLQNNYNELTEVIDPLKWDMFLMSPPSLGIEHQFNVQVNLSDGRILSVLSPKINLI